MTVSFLLKDVLLWYNDIEQSQKILKESIAFNFQLITLASKDVFIKILPNTNVIKALDKSNKIVM